MRILLTGSSGFIGRRIARVATHAGHEVRTFDRVPFKGESPDVLADVTDADALDKAMRGIDVVSHQAAKVGLGVDLQDMPGYVSNNDLGTAQILAAMARADVRALVIASSMVVYGEGAYSCDRHGPQPAPPRSRADLDAGRFDPACPVCGTRLTPELVDESARLDPRNTYAASKVSQEHLSTVWAEHTGGRAIALRYHNVYGPGMPRDTPYAGVASIFRSQIASGKAPQVFEDGEQRRDFIHVDDVAAANLAALESVRGGNTARWTAYNVGTGRVRTVHDMALALSDALNGLAPQVTGQYRLGDVRHITASSQQIVDELGWTPQIDFAEGMTQLARE